MQQDPDTLFHFTSFDSFLKIWSTQTLKFGYMTSLNDINDVSKITLGGIEADVRRELSLYKQISLMLPSENQQYAAMWGHYGDNGQGVCLEFDRTKLLNALDIKQLGDYYHETVNYVDNLEPIFCDDSDVDDAIQANLKAIFFTKTQDWSYEREFRIVSKSMETIDISGTLSGITITDLFGSLPQNMEDRGFRSELFKKVLQPIISEQIKVWEFCSSSFKGTRKPIWQDISGQERYPEPIILDDSK